MVSTVAGWRADKAALIGVLCRRTAAQRAAIRRAYAFLYREPLLNCFRYKLSRHCLLSVDFWVGSIEPPAIRWMPRTGSSIACLSSYSSLSSDDGMQIEFSELAMRFSFSSISFVDSESDDPVDDGSG